jgi:hypothetical protein
MTRTGKARFNKLPGYAASDVSRSGGLHVFNLQMGSFGSSSEVNEFAAMYIVVDVMMESTWPWLKTYVTGSDFGEHDTGQELATVHEFPGCLRRRFCNNPKDSA